jgi:ComF family protein
MKKKNIIIKLLYPQRCKYCNNVIDIRREICHTCENTLNKIEGDICKLGGMSVTDCHCGHKKHYYKCVCAPFYYDGAASRAIWRFKFRNATNLSKVFAEDMAKCFDTYYKGYDFDLCTFVPSSNDAIKKRGYNQAQLLAKDFSELTNIECRELLLKTKETKIQHDLLSVERSGNLAGAIEVKYDEDLENKRILLIDDIKTTGSTLNECAKMLLIGGAAEVFCLTVAITNKKEEKNSDF